jgi:hypothetical protein
MAARPGSRVTPWLKYSLTPKAVGQQIDQQPHPYCHLVLSSLYSLLTQKTPSQRQEHSILLGEHVTPNPFVAPHPPTIATRSRVE